MIHSGNSNSTRKSERNLIRFHGDAAVSAIDDAAVSYQAPSIIAVGANTQSISVLTMLVNLCLSLVCLKAPGLIERIGKGKKGAVTLAFLNLCAWVPLILMFLLAPMGISPVWFALLWCINLMPGLLLTFQRDNWLSSIVPGDKIGRYLGQRLAIKSAFYLGAFCFLGYMLDFLGNVSLLHFALLFTIALGVALVDFVIFTFMHEPKEKRIDPPKPEYQAVKFGLLDFMGEVKTKKLGAFVIFTSMFYLTVGLSGPLYVVYMLQIKNFTYLNFTTVISAEYLARIVSAPFWGRFADKSGNIRVLAIVSRVIPVIPVCWLFCSNIGYLAVVQTVSGICWGAFDLSTQNYIYKVAPPEKKLRYIVYTRCLVLFSTALGGLAGVYIIRGTFTIFGSQILGVFLLSALFRAVIVMFLMPKLIDMAVTYGKPLVAPDIRFNTSGAVPITRRGLYYQRTSLAPIPAKNQMTKDNLLSSLKYTNAAPQRKWTLERSTAMQTMTKKTMIEIPSGIRIIPRRNLSAMEKAMSDIMNAADKPTAPPSRQPWYGNDIVQSAYTARMCSRPVNKIVENERFWFNNPDVHSAYNARVRNAAQQAMEEAERRTSSRGAIFHDNYAWQSYSQESLRAAFRESRQGKSVGRVQPVLVESAGRISWRPWRDSNPRPTA